MATHALGRGTCNLSVNVNVSVHRTLGRLAFQSRARSTGAFVRLLLNKAGITTAVVAAVSPDSPGGARITKQEADRIAAEALRAQ
jgi:hypothetical protein